jgi:hypothetical protein
MNWSIADWDEKNSVVLLDKGYLCLSVGDCGRSDITNFYNNP